MATNEEAVLTALTTIDRPASFKEVMIASGLPYEIVQPTIGLLLKTRKIQTFKVDNIFKFKVLPTRSELLNTKAEIYKDNSYRGKPSGRTKSKIIKYLLEIKCITEDNKVEVHEIHDATNLDDFASFAYNNMIKFINKRKLYPKYLELRIFYAYDEKKDTPLYKMNISSKDNRHEA